MLATNAEISASATTLVETVIARNAKDGTEKIGYKHGKPNCFLCLILLACDTFRVVQHLVTFLASAVALYLIQHYRPHIVTGKQIGRAHV